MSSSFHTEVFLVDFTIFFGESQTFTTNQKVKIRRKYHCTVTVMSKYHKMDTNKYPNIFGFHIMNRTNIQIYLDAIYLPNEHPNIFVLRARKQKKNWQKRRSYEPLFGRQQKQKYWCYYLHQSTDSLSPVCVFFL